MKQYSVEQFIDQFVFSDTKDIMQNNPYQAFALISFGIEILGKCFYKGPWDKHVQSEDCFNRAIKSCQSLGKYSRFDIVVPSKSKCFLCRKNKTTNELYRFLRCGMAHSLKPSGQLTLVPDNNDFDNHVIGCNDLYDDCLIAWRDIKNGKTRIKKNLTELIYYVDDAVSGNTPTIVTKVAQSRSI